MALPSALAVKVAKIQVSSIDNKMIPSVDKVASSSILTYAIQPTGMKSLNSFFTHQDVVPTFTGAGTVRVNRFAPLYSKVIVELNGTTLNATSHLPELWTALNQLDSTSVRRNRQNIYESGEPKSLASGASEKIVIQEFPGTFIGTASQRIVDMALLPDVKIHFYTATPAQVLCKDGAVADVNYELRNCYAGIRSHSIDDGGVFYSETARFLAIEGNTRNIVYDNWLSTPNTKTGVVGTTSIDVQTNSIDRAMVLPLVAQNTLSAYNPVSKTSACYDRAVSNDYEWQYTLAGFQYPMYMGTVSTAFALNANTFGQKYKNAGGLDPLCSNATQWASPFFASTVSFELDGAKETTGHWITGINTSDSCQRLSYTCSGTATTPPALTDLLFVKTSSILKVYADKNIRITA